MKKIMDERKREKEAEKLARFVMHHRFCSLHLALCHILAVYCVLCDILTGRHRKLYTLHSCTDSSKYFNTLNEYIKNTQFSDERIQIGRYHM